MVLTKVAASAALLCVFVQMISAYSVIGLPESPLLTRHKRSSGVNCSTEMVDNFIKSANETCSQISVVDKYIANVKTRQPSPVPSFTDRHGFKAVLNQYNSDLVKAKNNSNPWRSGDSVVGSIKVMVNAAKEFEPKFNEELAQNNIRIENMLKNHTNIAKYEEKLRALEHDIELAKEALEHANVVAVQTHLMQLIKDKEAEINSTMEEHNIVQARSELAELVKYLEFVKNKSSDVEIKADNTRNKIASFQEAIVKDSTAFKRHRTNAQNSIKKIQEETKKNNDEINENRNTVNSLRAKISGSNNQIVSLRAQIARAHQEMRDMEAYIARSFRKAKKKRRFGRWFRFVPVVGWTIGSKLYKDAKNKQSRLNQEKTRAINQHNSRIGALQSQISHNNGEIRTHEQRITSLAAKSEQLQQELQHFSQLNGNLQSVENEVTGILPFIANAIKGVSQMQETFNTIMQNLADAIQRAGEAKTEAEISNVKYFIYNEINDIKCKWDNANSKIASLKQCN